MSRPSTPNPSQLNDFTMIVEQPKVPERFQSPSKMPRPFVPEMKRMRPFILNSSTPSPTLLTDRHNSHTCLSPASITSQPFIHRSRSHEPMLSRPAQETHNSKHPFDATDHVIMRMEFVKPAVDTEELWVECFKKWSKIHRKATADQWRWLYENRVMPTETADTLPSEEDVALKQLKSSRSIGLMNTSFNQQLESIPKPSSLLIRRSRKKAEAKHILDSEKTPTPLNLTRDTGFYAKDGKCSPVYFDSKIAPILRPSDLDWDEVTRFEDDISSDESNTDGAESLKSTNLRQSIDTSSTSILSSHVSRRGESLAPHYIWTGKDLAVKQPVVRLEQASESCFEIESDDEDDDFFSLRTPSRHSLFSCDENFVPTPLTAIPAKAYSHPQKIQVRRSSSQSSRSDVHVSLMPDGLRFPRARSIPSSAIRVHPKIAPWTPPVSHSRHSDMSSDDKDIENSPRSSSLPRESSDRPITSEMRYSSYSEDSGLSLGSPPLTPNLSKEEEEFATPTQESVLQEKLVDLPKAKLDFQVKPQASFSSIDTSIGDAPLFRHPAILPSQIASFSTGDEYILHDLEKAVCGVKPSLNLSTSCISQIRIITHSKINNNTIATPETTKTSTINNNDRSICLPRKPHGHPLKSHPPNMKSLSSPTTKSPMTRLFSPIFFKNNNFQASEIQSHSQAGKAVLNPNPRQHHHNRRQSREITPPSSKHGARKNVPSPPDLASFRIIFPATTNEKRDELYAYLLAYNYLINLPKPLNHTTTANTTPLRFPSPSHLPRRPQTPPQTTTTTKTSRPRTTVSQQQSSLQSPFSSTPISAPEGINNFKFPHLPNPETVITAKAGEMLGIMSSEESLRTVSLEGLAFELVSRVKEGISRLVGEMDVVRGGIGSDPGGSVGGNGARGKGGRGVRGEGYVIERTLLRTLVEHVGVCEENGWLSEENGGLWKRIFWRVRGRVSGGKV